MACSTTSSRLAVCAIPTVGINHADRTALSIMGLIFTDDSLFLDPNSWFFSWGSILRRSIFDRTARENFFVRESVHRHLLPRSEEHTSELQSRGHLVCRLLLVKKTPSCYSILDILMTHHFHAPHLL